MGRNFAEVLIKYNLKISNDKLFQTAFTHRSYLNEIKREIESNERLEFLGDSVLSFIVSTYLYSTRPEDEEGELTNLRAYIVKTESLAKAAKNLDLGDYLLLSKGEELSGGNLNSQILANTYEAVLGAIYLDQGVEAARKFVYLILIPIFSQEVSQGAPRDPKSQLQELSQSKFQTSPKYKIISASGPDHAKEFTVGVFLNNDQIGEGLGSSKQQAEEEAARVALSRLTKEHA